MSELNDNVTGFICSNIMITMENTEMDSVVSDSKEKATSFCTKTNELHEDNLQVLNSSTSPNDTKETDEIEKPRYSFKGSMASLAAEVFTTRNITTAVKCRLVIILIVTICLMILLFLTPIVLYNINPPNAEKYVTESTIFYGMEVDSCSVSDIMIIYKICIMYAYVRCVYQGETNQLGQIQVIFDRGNWTVSDPAGQVY